MTTLTNRTQEAISQCRTDMSHARILETTYTCRCGRSEYNDVELVYGPTKVFKMPRITDCPECDNPVVRTTNDPWAAGVLREMQETKRGLYLFGIYGTGKTTSAERVRAEAQATGLTTRFTTTSRFITRMKDARRSFERETDALNEYAASQVLVLDDAGNEELTEQGLSDLWDLTDSRYQNGHATIWTSNYPLSRLVARYAEVNPVMAESLGSRIGGTTTAHEFTGTDRRAV